MKLTSFIKLKFIFILSLKIIISSIRVKAERRMITKKSIAKVCEIKKLLVFNSKGNCSNKNNIHIIIIVLERAFSFSLLREKAQKNDKKLATNVS